MNCKHNYARVNEPRAYSDSMINRGRTAARKVNLHISIQFIFHGCIGWDFEILLAQIKRGFSSYFPLYSLYFTLL